MKKKKKICIKNSYRKNWSLCLNYTGNKIILTVFQVWFLTKNQCISKYQCVYSYIFLGGVACRSVYYPIKNIKGINKSVKKTFIFMHQILLFSFFVKNFSINEIDQISYNKNLKSKFSYVRLDMFCSSLVYIHLLIHIN